MLLVRSLVIILIAILVLACAKLAEPNRVANRSVSTDPRAVNINTASVEELEKLPHIGPNVAAKIVEHREKNGPFRLSEHLMMIDGISEKRFREIRPLIRVE